MNINLPYEISCGDCLCRVCGHNMCGSGEGCTGCNDCTGIVETEDDCVNSLGFIFDELLDD